jgi:hypothetical protein
MADTAAARLAADQLARQVAQQAARQAAEQAARQAAEQLTRRGFRQAAEQAAETAAERAARLAAEQAAETAAERAARLAAEQAAETAAEQAAKKAAKTSAKDAALYAGAAAAAGLGLYTYIEAKERADESNNTPREITKVEYSSDSQSVLKITFTPALRILLSDDLTFRDTQTTPVINGPATVKDVLSNSQIEVDFGSTQVVSLQPGGYIDVKTTVSGQAGALVGDAGDALGDAGGNFLGGLLPDWMNNMGDIVKKVLLVICCLIFSGIIAFVASKFL